MVKDKDGTIRDIHANAIWRRITNSYDGYKLRFPYEVERDYIFHRDFYYIYTFRESEASTEYRYVGITFDPVRRYKQHLSQGSSRFGKWVRELTKRGIKPYMEFSPMGFMTFEQARQIEKQDTLTIQFDWGHPLLNKRYG